MTRKAFAPYVDDLYRRYQAGESLREITVDFGGSATGLHDAFKRRGYTCRPPSADAAHAAVRGIAKSLDDLCLKAVGRERTQANVSPLDRAFATMLDTPAIINKAIGPYNIDVAVHPVAVEIYGGGWHAAGRAAARFPKRARYILDCGWHLVIIWVSEKSSYPLTIAASEYVRSLIDFPPAPSHGPSVSGDSGYRSGDDSRLCEV